MSCEPLFTLVVFPPHPRNEVRKRDSYSLNRSFHRLMCTKEKKKKNSFVIKLGLYISFVLLSLTKIIHKSMLYFLCTISHVFFFFFFFISIYSECLHSQRDYQCGLVCNLKNYGCQQQTKEQTNGWYAARIRRTISTIGKLLSNVYCNFFPLFIVFVVVFSCSVHFDLVSFEGNSTKQNGYKHQNRESVLKCTDGNKS